MRRKRTHCNSRDPQDLRWKLNKIRSEQNSEMVIRPVDSELNSTLADEDNSLELADNSNPRWKEVSQMFDKNQCKSGSKANPKYNLTLVQYSTSERSSNRTTTPVCPQQIKESHQVDGPDIPQPHSVSCSLILDKLLAELNDRLKILTTPYQAKKISPGAQVKPVRYLKMKRRTRKYLALLEQRQKLGLFSKRKLMAALKSYRTEIQLLKSVRDDVLNFHGFYERSTVQHQGWDSSDPGFWDSKFPRSWDSKVSGSWDSKIAGSESNYPAATCLSLQEAQDLLETEDMISSYWDNYNRGDFGEDDT
ncbi:hypothetical protein M8J77_012014 [Diaphorina citri]|nr:hypothetical protein M8J77_012014 [Diaphorina citri]